MQKPKKKEIGGSSQSVFDIILQGKAVVVIQIFHLKHQKMSLDWSKLPIQQWLKEAISSLGFTEMTTVQASAIPIFLQNKDVVVEAVTGSGKTLSFVIPIIEKTLHLEHQKYHANAIVLAPTRELAQQIDKVFQSVLQYNPQENGVRTQLVLGGVNTLEQDLETFRKRNPHILISTPGRLQELIKTKKVKTADLELLILDEADRLLDVNFSKEMDYILSSLPKQKRTGLFSATISKAYETLHRTGIRNPIKIKVNAKNNKPKSLQMYYHVVKPEDKLSLMFKIFTEYHFQKAMVYFPTCIAVDYYYQFFKTLAQYKDQLKFFSLHGKLKTPARLKTLANFESSQGAKTILMTTDVASRGIDIDDVDLIIQLDPPTDPDSFMHRCGRTGRAGRFGQAITLLNDGREEDYINFLEVKDVDIDELDLDYESGNDLGLTKWVLEDRARHDKAVRSFVSFIRYYSKHTVNSIFRVSNIDWVSLAKLYGITRLPSMPEINKKDTSIPDFIGDYDFAKWESFKYLDSNKEQARLDELAKEKLKLERQEQKKKKEENSAWSKKVIKKQIRNEKSINKRDLELDLQSDNESEQEMDWKDMIRQQKKQKKSNDDGISQFDDL